VADGSCWASPSQRPRWWRPAPRVKLLHTDVYNDKNEKIGKVDDLIVSTDGTYVDRRAHVGASSAWPSNLVVVPGAQLQAVRSKAILPNASKDH
jgi:hypothetical protein